METLDSLIAILNNLELGELDKIDAQLEAVRAELEQRELAELGSKLEECRRALSLGDLDDFRRLRATVVSQLGHVRRRTD